MMTDDHRIADALAEAHDEPTIDPDALLAAPYVLYGTAMGLYHLLAAERLTGAELAERARVPAADARAWLRAQTASGHVTRGADDRYYLTPEQALILVEDETPPGLLYGWAARRAEGAPTGRGPRRS